MSSSLMFGVLCIGMVLLSITFYVLLKGRITIKYALVWFLPISIILLVSIVPQTLWEIAKILGFQSISTMVIGIILVLLFIIIMSLTIIVSGQKTKLTLLIQEISIMNKRIEELESRKDENE